jgi:hypothetical protein
MRGMSEFEAEYEKKGVTFLCVNALEPPEAGRAWIETSGLDFDWAFADQPALDALGVKMVPTQLILDKDGKVAWKSSFGSITGGPEAIRTALDEVIDDG